MLLDNVFNKGAYISDRSLNHWYMGAMLQSLSAAQHLYDRRDIAKVYHFLGDLFESGDFDWGGTNRLTNVEESAKVEIKETRSVQSPSGEMTQPCDVSEQTAKPVTASKASKQKK